MNKQMWSYHTGQCKSTISWYPDKEDSERKPEELIHRIKNGWAVAWFENRIQFYKVENDKWSDDLGELTCLVRLRVFDADKELHLWKNNGILKGRLREDQPGNEICFITAHPILNGSRFTLEAGGKYILAEEDKGTRFRIPYDDSFKELLNDDQKNRLRLITRNYIGYYPSVTWKQPNASNQSSSPLMNEMLAGYEDCRFCGFVIEKNQ
ncbi:MAG: CRISPR-associated protein Csx19 [Bacteroidales bacterium]|nr:CRISPR-associated protein Csx19 [Bacteroidales bacterium]